MASIFQQFIRLIFCSPSLFFLVIIMMIYSNNYMFQSNEVKFVFFTTKLLPGREPPNSGGDGVTQWRRSGYVLQRLSSIAQMCLVSSTLRYFSLLTVHKVSMSPSLHFSISGTFLTGRAVLILAVLYCSGLLSPVRLERYLKFREVEDLGSEDTILESSLTSLLGEWRRLLKNPEYLDKIWFLRLV